MGRKILRSKIIPILKERDGNICGICKKEMRSGRVTLDHILPISKGGKNLVSNLQLAHFQCNNMKGDIVDFELTPPARKASEKIKIDHGPIDSKATKKLFSYRKLVMQVLLTD